MARRRNLVRDVRNVLKKEHGSSLVPATFLVMGVLDLIPIPTDVGYFYVQRWLMCNQDRLTKKQRWLVQYANYYGWDATWYLSLFLITYFGGKSMKSKLALGGGAVAAGALATLLWKFTHPTKPMPLSCSTPDADSTTSSTEATTP